ncbi:hypothetical protein [Streptomyces sp. NPDC056290]|uniref:hypothetical protein n=1 Tax=Streptomyces sp. NPDC056290 TaxID=3345771 RepID=UPI0035DA5877
MAVISRVPCIPRWVGARLMGETHVRDGVLSLDFQVHVPPVRGALYCAWVYLRSRMR